MKASKMTVNGVSVCATGEENYERFEARPGKWFYQYDYRHTDNDLFSVVLPTLEMCREARDKWLAERNVSKTEIDAFEMAVSNTQPEADSTATPTEKVTGNFTIIAYSEKSVAIFGDTRSIKQQLAALGGRFNMYLLVNGRRCSGWIFQKCKEQDLRKLVNLF